MEEKNKIQVIALYLPQFHSIPENDKWWGKGFTEWKSVVKAKKLYIGHKQPHFPGELGFYDLRLEEVRIKQAELAKEYGVTAFCYWHYWFGNGKRLLEMPFNEVLSSGKPDFPFCLAWANHSWEKKLWDKNGTREMLIQQQYLGIEDYTDHFYTMLPAFKDPRYVKVAGGKLLFIIYAALASPQIPVFIKTWRDLAKQNGIGDFYFVSESANNRLKDQMLATGCDAVYNSDIFNIHHKLPLTQKIFYWVTRNIFSIPTVFSYKKAIKHMVSDKDKPVDSIPVVAPNWDHSPRSGRRGILLKGSTPELFKQVVLKALNIVKNKPEENRIIIIKSWNEWGEGNYMEPDEEFGRGNLEALRDAINDFEKNQKDE